MILIAMIFVYGCGEKSTSVQETGLDLRFANCFIFAVWVEIDGNYQGTFSSERSGFIPLKAGSHTLYARSNMELADTGEYYCWTTDFTVSKNKITTVLLDCEGHTCIDTTITSTSAR